MKERIDQEKHDFAVKKIAEIRFSFPNREHPSWKTYVNHPEQNMGITTDNELVYPDIVVVDTNSKKAVMIGEVETEDSVDEEETEQWQEYSHACKLMYLYVPIGYCDDVIELCKDNDVDITGFRYYKTENGFYVFDCEEG